MSHRLLRCGHFTLPIGQRTLIMGVLNVTPDSFAGDGVFADPHAAAARARRMIEEGADLIDIGGESTRPGSDPVGAEEELQRVIPVIERLADVAVPICVDTSKAEVAEAALRAGASVVNDITALRGSERMAEVVAECGAAIVLMHMKGTPRYMQDNPCYGDVVREVNDFLRQRLSFAQQAGIAMDRIAVDPGIGFGKTLEHNLQLLRHLDATASLGCPVLVGTSRKSFIGKLTGAPVDGRAFGTAASVALAIARGADMVRVHDVKEMKQVVTVADTIVRGMYTWTESS